MLEKNSAESLLRDQTIPQPPKCNTEFILAAHYCYYYLFYFLWEFKFINRVVVNLTSLVVFLDF